jgi:hypothetical protein
MYGKPWRIENSKVMNRQNNVMKSQDYPKNMSMHQAFLPYYVLDFYYIIHTAYSTDQSSF